jgi:hypothetical protein
MRRIAGLVFIAAAAVCAMGATPAHVEQPAPMEIFERARTAVNKLSLPPYTSFTVEEDGYDSFSSTDRPAQSIEHQERCRILARTADGYSVAVQLKDPYGEDVRHPAPRVVTNGWFLPMSRIWQVGDFPTADFGLRYARPARHQIFEAPGTPIPEASPLSVITTVTAHEPPHYSVSESTAGTTIGGRSVYHLLLSPIRDPGHSVIREMWIDEATYLPVRYVLLRYVPQDRPFSYLITVDTQLLDGHLVNVSANGLYHYANVSGRGRWRISQVSFPQDVPDWAFNQGQWAQHNGVPIPGFAPASP